MHDTRILGKKINNPKIFFLPTYLTTLIFCETLQETRNFFRASSCMNEAQQFHLTDNFKQLNPLELWPATEQDHTP